MKILIDTNVVLDVLLMREPFCEDSVQYSVALLQEMDGIITRNPDDYKQSEIKVWLPKQALEEIQMQDD